MGRTGCAHDETARLECLLVATRVLRFPSEPIGRTDRHAAVPGAHAMRRRRHVALPALVAVGALFGLLLGMAHAVGDDRLITATALVQRVAAGQDVDLEGFVIDGDVDLRSVRTVTRPLRCLQCRFTGAWRARDVIFERSVDLSMATIAGAVDLSGAVFKDPVSFTGVKIGGSTSLASAHFLKRASFAEADFAGAASFEHAVFDAGASFVGGPQSSFHEEATFRYAEWGADSDFGQRRFDGPANFLDAVFIGRASFTLVGFESEAQFDRCALRAGAAFRAAVFSRLVSFERCRVGGPMDFEGATFEAKGRFNNLAAASLSFTGVNLPDCEATCDWLVLDGLVTPELTMDIWLVDGVQGPTVREDVLALLERSAQQNEDLVAANNARYRLLSLRSAETRGIGRLFDQVLYRSISGYLVRPVHPLATLGLIILFGGAVRAAVSFWAAPVHWLRRPLDSVTGRSVWHQLVLASQKIVSVILEALAGALAAVFRRKPTIVLGDAERVRSYCLAGLQWVEYLGSKVVLAVFLLTLGNSNATIRQLLDAVRG